MATSLAPAGDVSAVSARSGAVNFTTGAKPQEVRAFSSVPHLKSPFLIHLCNTHTQGKNSASQIAENPGGKPRSALHLYCCCCTFFVLIICVFAVEPMREGLFSVLSDAGGNPSLIGKALLHSNLTNSFWANLLWIYVLEFRMGFNHIKICTD